MTLLIFLFVLVFWRQIIVGFFALLGFAWVLLQWSVVAVILGVGIAYGYRLL